MSLRINHLQAGPRALNLATQHFVTVARSFLRVNPPPHRQNRLGELEVCVDGVQYNLTRILAHHPDFEHMDFALTAEEEARGVQLLKPFTSEYHNKQDGILNEAERRAIYYYSLDDKKKGQYRLVNEFLRMHGQINDLGVNNKADLKTIMCLLVFLPQAIIKLRAEVNDSAVTLYRGELYTSESESRIVVQVRTRHRAGNIEYGFFSSTEQKHIAKEHFQSRNSQHHNLLISVKQLENRMGANIQSHTAFVEAEVGFVPGTQFVFEQIANELYATAVRSVDHHHPHYDANIIDLRRNILNLSDGICKAGKSDLHLVKMMDDFCQKVALANPGILTQTVMSCEKVLTLLSAMEKSLPHELNSIIAYQLNINLINKYAKEKLIAEIKVGYAALIKHAWQINALLQEPYTDTDICDEDVTVKINGIVIQRPNHGLAHTLRVAFYIPVIAVALQSHAQNENLLHFLNSQQLKLIQLATLFSVTGRKSEAARLKAPDAYLAYRINSKQQFLQYVTEHAEEFDMTANNEIILKLAEQVEKMGNPDFLKQLIDAADYPGIYTYILINLAHKLDLLRCYEKAEFERAIEPILQVLTPLVDDSFLEKALPALYSMAQLAITATGDRLITQYVNGNFESPRKHYTNAFIECSTNPEACMIACFTQVPVFTAVYDGATDIDIKLLMSRAHQAVLDGDIPTAKDLLKTSAVKYPLLNQLLYHPEQVRALLTSGVPHEWLPEELIIILHCAIRACDIIMFEAVLALKVDVNFVNSMGQSALHVALRQINKTMAKRLLSETDANIWLTDNMGWMPIVNIVKCAPNDMIDYVRGVDVNGTNIETVFRILFYAANNDAGNVIQRIVSSHHGSLDLSRKDEHGNTLLHLAVIKKLGTGVAKELITRSDLVCTANKNGETPIELAAKNKDINMFLLLIKRGQFYTRFEKHVTKAMKLLLATIANPFDSYSQYLMSPFHKFFNTLVTERLNIAPEVERAIKAMSALDADEYRSMTKHTPGDSGFALLQVVSIQHEEIVNCILNEEKVNFETLRQDGNTVLHIAAAGMNADIVAALLKHNQSLLTVKNKNNETPLDVAASKGHLEAIVHMVEALPAEARGNVIDTRKLFTQLINVMFNTHIMGLRKIIKSRILSIADMMRNAGNYIDPNLYLAIRAAHAVELFNRPTERIVKRFLAHPVNNINEINNDDFETTLHEAVKIHEIALVQILLEHPDIRLDVIESLKGRMPIDYAIDDKNIAIFKMLLDHPKSDMSIRTKSGYTVLHRVVLASSVEMVEMTLKHPRVDINAQDNDGLTALQLTVTFKRYNNNSLSVDTETSFAAKRLKMVELFLQNDACDVNHQDKDGTTALMLACSNATSPIVRALVLCPRLDPTLTTSDGRNAFSFAVEHIHTPVENVIALLQREGDIGINQPDNKKISPLMYGLKIRSPEAAAAIMKDKRFVFNLNELIPPKKDYERQCFIMLYSMSLERVLYIAVMADRVDVVQELLNFGLYPNKSRYNIKELPWSSDMRYLLEATSRTSSKPGSC